MHVALIFVNLALLRVNCALLFLLPSLSCYTCVISNPFPQYFVKAAGGVQALMHIATASVPSVEPGAVPRPFDSVGLGTGMEHGQATAAHTAILSLGSLCAQHKPVVDLVCKCDGCCLRRCGSLQVIIVCPGWCSVVRYLVSGVTLHMWLTVFCSVYS